jgi:hypothetical protein
MTGRVQYVDLPDLVFLRAVESEEGAEEIPLVVRERVIREVMTGSKLRSSIR